MSSKPSGQELELIAEKLSAWAESDDFYNSMINASARKATATDKEKHES